MIHNLTCPSCGLYATRHCNSRPCPWRTCVKCGLYGKTTGTQPWAPVDTEPRQLDDNDKDQP